MEQRTRTVEARLAELEAAHAALAQRCGRAERRLRVACGLGVAALAMALFASPATRATAQAGYGATLQSLINKTQFISVDANGEMHITNTNLHLENGLGATNGDPSNPVIPPGVTNGKGNLIIGYNLSKVPLGGTDHRTGSHNLVLGDGNDYTSYGGIVAGSFNAISGAYASVTGGQRNTASGENSSVTGGDLNLASGLLSSVSGGIDNTASGEASSVSGGFNHNQGGRFIWQGGTLISGP
jgi:hypothetical protein